MSLGLCCQWLENTPKGIKNILVSRTLQLGRYQAGEYSKTKIAVTYLENVQNLCDVFPKIIAAGIKSFRISSSMFPLYDLVDRSAWDNEKIKTLLKKIGDSAQTNKIRLTTHPGQFCVLSSTKDEVIMNAVKEIQMHAQIMDWMGLDRSPYYSINVHGGQKNSGDRLVDGICLLNDSAASRLTIENCEFAYSVKQLVEILKTCQVPVVFDSHHHNFNTGGLNGKEAMEAAMATWPKHMRPLTHLSSSRPEYPKSSSVSKLREHSDRIYAFPDYQLSANNAGGVDIDIEAKHKNLAVLEAVEKFGAVM